MIHRTRPPRLPNPDRVAIHMNAATDLSSLSQPQTFRLNIWRLVIEIAAMVLVLSAAFAGSYYILKGCFFR